MAVPGYFATHQLRALARIGTFAIVGRRTQPASSSLTGYNSSGSGLWLPPDHHQVLLQTAKC